MTRVELFEAIRRDHRVEGLGVRAIARKRGVHRRVVRQAMGSAVPPARKRADREAPVVTEEVLRRIDEWLRADTKAPRKQRHTARRIYQRLRSELGFEGAEATVRRVVGERRRAIGPVTQAFVPLWHPPGAEAEVDWYEAAVDFPHGRETVQVFQMRACHSGREFHMAFPRQTQQAFLEAHAAAFAYFGGVFERVRYDNLKAAARKVLRGRRRIESDRFVLLRSHYGFDAVFCLPGEEGAHEKGGVEGAVGRFRRTHLVPVPRVESYEALNELLREAMAADDQRHVDDRPRSIQESWADEAPLLQALPATPFQAQEVGEAVVDSLARVSVCSNRYSVPVRLVGRRVETRTYAQRVEVWHGGKRVASHERLQGRGGERLELDHYLELLWFKPGAMPAARPLLQARARGRFPDSYTRLWEALRARYGEAEGTRQMLAVLMLHREAPSDEVHLAVGLALEHGCYDAGAVATLLRQLREPERKSEPLQDLGALARFERPPSTVADYDLLLVRRSSGMGVH